ncbi:MAG: pyruvate dehydrogenase (acetyl-transferring) E1 component subunit alpha [Phycisphaerae bacterium]|nr:pyruvate dehydrogenase (acetyl-transferring) E1 component subunit alpha [Phycisphaerae bacterium]
MTPAPNAKAAPRLSDTLPASTVTKWLRDMMLIREFELRTMAAYQQAKIGGFCHVYIGQEATAVGTIAAVNHDDPVITAYRDHGHALARGMSSRACMAEMYGKTTGCAKGKGGSMHMFDKPNHLYGGHGIVGAQTGLGVGLAFASRYEWEVLNKGSKKVCLCYLGDGALNQGVFHESLNLAGLYDAPVIYIVENNGYSMGTSIERGTTMAHDLSVKAAAYGIDFIEIDGMDVCTIYDRFKPFADDLRERQRPGFVDLKTYRYQGHSMSDPQKYRTKEEVADWQQRDSIDRLAHLLLHRSDEPRAAAIAPSPWHGSLSEDAYKQMQKEIREEVRDAIDFAEKSDSPDPAAELYTDVYANPQPNLSPLREYHHGAKNPLL